MKTSNKRRKQKKKKLVEIQKIDDKNTTKATRKKQKIKTTKYQ